MLGARLRGARRELPAEARRIPAAVQEGRTLHPLIPAKAGTQTFARQFSLVRLIGPRATFSGAARIVRFWVPAFAGMSGDGFSLYG